MSRMITEISVETPIGVLSACIGGDPDNYPEIFCYITRPDGVEIDLTAVCIDRDEQIVRAYLYGDTATDCYTKQHTWSAEEINIQED